MSPGSPHGNGLSQSTPSPFNLDHYKYLNSISCHVVDVLVFVFVSVIIVVVYMEVAEYVDVDPLIKSYVDV